jgi:manganese/zinc/iron transport system permease protein
MGDAVSHAVLPGIVGVFLLFETRAPIPVVMGATVFAIICVVAIDALKATQLVKADAAIGLVFPALFSLGVLGITSFASNIHLDLDSTIYGEIAFTPFRDVTIFGAEVARSIIAMGVVTLLNLTLIVILWKELKVTTFDHEFSHTIGFSPPLVSRVLLVATAVTAVSAFESVGAILVVTMLIVPAAAAYLVVDRLSALVILTVGIGWFSAVSGHWIARQLDASIAGSMGMMATVIFVCAFLLSPRYGLLVRAWKRHSARDASRAVTKS